MEVLGHGVLVLTQLGFSKVEELQRGLLHVNL